jgi:hypothetical protein
VRGAGGAHFYISLSAVWTFIGTIGSAAGLTAAQIGMVLAAATVCGIIGAGGAACAARGARTGYRSGWATAC